MYTDPCRALGCLDLVGHYGAKGYCSRHYKRFMRYGDPLAGGPIRPNWKTLQHDYVEQYLQDFPLTEVLNIPLSQGLVTVIDRADWTLVKEHAWFPREPKDRETIYVQTSSSLSLHRMIMGTPNSTLVDHRDRNGLNNRRTNLRVATVSQNNANSKLQSNNSSGYKGVSWCNHRNKWRAHIRVNGTLYSLGRFSNPWEAALAYNTAALYHFGEFARINTKHN